MKMQTQSERRLVNDAPLYIRWLAERPAVAIELKLDLVDRIGKLINAAEGLGMEIGGILLGTPPNAINATLRIEDFDMISRRPEDGAAFMLDPREHDRFLTTRSEPRTKGRAVVGLFRTHLRSGPLRPSLADRTLLAGEFSDQLHLILLIQSAQPRTSAIFIGSRTTLAEEPSVPEFHFDAAEFSGLPEVESAPLVSSGEPAPKARGNWLRIMAVVLCASLVAGLCLLFAPADFLPSFDSSPGLDLTVSGDRIVKIAWNRSSAAIGRAVAAKLIIADGRMQREVPVGSDELRLGVVNYQRSTSRVNVTFVLEMPGATSLVQSQTWHP